MYRRRPYARRPRKYVRKGKKGVRVSKPLRRAMTQVAKRVISRRAEDKVTGSPVEADVLHNSAIGSADCEPVIMQIAQGVDSSMRVGDRVTPKSLHVKGVLALNPAVESSVTQTIYARVVILAQKDIKSGAEILSGGVDAGALLRAGYGSSGNEIQFTGVTQQLNMPINTELFRVYMDRTFKLITQSTGGNPQANPHDSVRWSYTFTKKHLPSSFHFDEGNGNWPNNFAPFVAIGYAYADGTAPDTITTELISNVYTQLKFEDI